MLILVVALAACGSRRTRAPEAVGPQLGESTAPGPTDPSRPLPDATGATEVSATISFKTGTAPIIEEPPPPPPPEPPGVFSPPPDAPPDLR